MDGAASGILDSVTHKTLHAQNFNRTSSRASHVLTDLLARYMSLLASTCARYAEHAGRGTVSMLDAMNALGEVGVSLEELMEYAEGEGPEMLRYAPQTARRMEELALLKEALEDGKRIDNNDAIPLVYAKMPEVGAFEYEEDDESEEDDRMEEDISLNHINGDVSMTFSDSRQDERTKSPVLPPSPVSRPVSPSRKRPRPASWNPPPHIPDFLPPFPASSVSVNGTLSRAPTPQPQINQEADVTTPSSTDITADRDRIPNLLPQQLATAASAADYLSPVPYIMSSLSSTPETHLPDRQLFRRSLAENGTALQLQPRKHQVPEVNQALMGAYHHLLTNPTPRTPSTNVNRHRVALAMMTQSYAVPRWTHSDSLFGDVAVPKPRVVAPGPTFPVLVNAKKDDQVPILPSASKTIAPPETIVALTSQPRSRIPDLSKAILPHPVILRASKLNPPPPLVNNTNGEKFLYGTGVQAPWNANNALSQSQAASNPNAKKKAKVADEDDVEIKKEKEKGKEENVLGDALLLATWDWEAHDYRMPPVQTKRMRALTGFGSGIGAGMDGVVPGGEPLRRNSIKIGKAK